MGCASSNMVEASNVSAKNDQASVRVSVPDWNSSEFGKWQVEKLFNLPGDNEVKIRLKTWCKQHPQAKSRNLIDLIDAFDEIAKRRAVFQSGQRCGDSLETGKEVLEANGKLIIEKYFKNSSPRYIGQNVSGDWEKQEFIASLNLANTFEFDSVAKRAPNLARFSTNAGSQKQLIFSRRWIRLISVAIIAALLFYAVFLLYHTTTSITSAQAKRLPNSRRPKTSQPPVKSLPAAYLEFYPADSSAATSNVEIFGDPSNRTEAAQLRRKYAESARDFGSRAFPQFNAALDRFAALDVGRYLTVPLSHFSLSEPIPQSSPSFDAENLTKAAHADSKYFEECGQDKKVDKRYTHKSNCIPGNNGAMPIIIHNTTVMRESLLGILSAWSTYSARHGITWWISHGEMIGWYWNGKLLPWDSDLDIQISTRQLVNLVAHNQTILEDRFLVDVNPAFAARRPVSGHANTIDARVVDTRTGYLMDITALTQTDPTDARVYCKSPHGYSYNQIFPLVETMLDGVKVWRPRAVMAIIAEEYDFKSLTWERHSTWTKGLYGWNRVSKVWERKDTGARTRKTRNATKTEERIAFALVGFSIFLILGACSYAMFYML
ncbi:hypothetical protein HK100_009932 [Physocladia obscura]|uniref:LicD/FKTN/FKRP nucleotidyltransferase domain-containing protein n=1 Tax=Physocladia obscura TaxID=109957 RepID=A0AAD5T2U0_9FUNG|nr:hypothetical protein HK100_009932 [Physocladia obscura]